MKPYTRMLIFCALYVACASKVPTKDPVGYRIRSSVDIDNLSRNSVQAINGTNMGNTDKSRDKRALGLLLSGLAQIFGYTVTPIQIASLPNPNTTMPATMSNSSTMNNIMKQHAAPSRPMPTNTTTPRRQETIRFTGVVNFGNNSDIIGHLQRYEQIFHGRGNNTTTTMMTSMTTTSRPFTMPMLHANISLNPKTTKPPLLAPFFVKIPLPIAPNLLPISMPIEGPKLSYPGPAFSIISESRDNEMPILKEHVTVYTNNDEVKRYMTKEKDVQPVSKYTHRLFVDEPNWNKQQNNGYNELQHKQQQYLERLKGLEVNNDENDYKEEEEVNEGYKNRNQGYVSASEESDEEDEDSVERYNERAGQANSSNKLLKQTLQNSEKKKMEDYTDYDDNNNSNRDGTYEESNETPPSNIDKYVEVADNQQLPIGDYFHERDPEEIRDSYGEVLNKRKMNDDRLSGYFSMFKQPHTAMRDFQKIHDSEDTSREDEKVTPAANGYEAHLERLLKLREEYALPNPENKYEEYDISDETDVDRNNKNNESVQNRTSKPTKPMKPKSERLNDKDDLKSNRNELQRNDDVLLKDMNLQEESDFSRYTPLVVPVRYLDVSDKVRQSTTRQLNDKKSDKLKISRSPGDDINTMPIKFKEQKLSWKIGIPEKPRQLHEAEREDFQISPPPFDYLFDNTERASAVLPPDQHNPKSDYYEYVTNTAANGTNSNSSERPSGYLVVVDNPVYPYPYNVYYFSNEDEVSQNQYPQLNAVGTLQDHVYVPRQSNLVRTDFTGYNMNETTTDSPSYYYEPQESQDSNSSRYGYVFGERVSETEEPRDTKIRGQHSNVENWSSRIYQTTSHDNMVNKQSQIPTQPTASPLFAKSARDSSPYSSPQLTRRRKSSRSEDERRYNRNVKLTKRPVLRRKPFDDPQSAHDFFGFSKDDYNFDGESSDASKVVEENDKIAQKSDVFVAPEQIAYYHDESPVEHTDEPENDTEKAIITEYKKKLATLKDKREEIQRRNDLENRMAEILENLKTRLLVE